MWYGWQMSSYPSTFRPAKPPSKASTSQDAVSFLRGHEALAALLPTATKLAKLQADCLTILPAQFSHCTVLNVNEGQLHIAVPNSALATRIKQMLPKLQSALIERGWQVEGIKLRIQVDAPAPAPPVIEGRELTSSALDSFRELNQNLENHPSNLALKQAIQNLLKRRGESI